MKITPAQQQYLDIKKQYNDCIVFFRMGDFYETFYEDAKITSRVCEITLTARAKETDHPIPMAWVPYHTLDKYIPKLIHAGYKIALAEQVGDVSPGKVVHRAVTQIITPGTYLEDHASKKIVGLVAVGFYQTTSASFHCARWSLESWIFYTKSFIHQEDLIKYVLMLSPKEIVIDGDLPAKQELIDCIHQQTGAMHTIVSPLTNPHNYLLQVLNVQTLEVFGDALNDGRSHAFSLLYQYATKNLHKEKLFIHTIFHDHQRDNVHLDDMTIKNCELFESSYDHNKKSSLYALINTTHTPMGAKILYHLLLHPTQSLTTIHHHHERIGYFIDNLTTTKNLTDIIAQLNDSAKIATQCLYRWPTPMLLQKLWQTWQTILTNEMLYNHLLAYCTDQHYREQYREFIDMLNTIFDTHSESFGIRDGYDSVIDQLRTIAYHSDDLLLQYQKRIVEATWISNVKIKFVSHQWFFCEITNKDIDHFEQVIEEIKKNNPDDELVCFRQQKLKWWQRYTSSYLIDLQDKILSAKQDLINAEQRIIHSVSKQIERFFGAIVMVNEAVGMLDVHTSHAIFADRHQRTKPEVVDHNTHPQHCHIVNGRHPVVQAHLGAHHHFVANSLTLGEYEHHNYWSVHIITWPNMWGKSTFLRQNALIVLLAHCGLYVPADFASMSLVDWIFARIGSWDILTKNQSTFMTEMIETATIIHTSSKRSFIVLDELGRGTSTYDGMALAHAIIDYFATQWSLTLFATHYHELTTMSDSIPAIKNFCVSVYENDHDIIFLKKIVAWTINKSYGIDVAKKAWIPQTIIEHAQHFLTDKEQSNNYQPSLWHKKNTSSQSPSDLFWIHPTIDMHTYNKIKTILKSTDIHHTTPLQALHLLSKLKDEID